MLDAQSGGFLGRALSSRACQGEPLALFRSRALAMLRAPGEAESGSAGVQPDKEYPGRRCADGASPLGNQTSRGLFLSPSDTGVMPWKTHRDTSTDVSFSHGSVSVWRDRLLFGFAGDPRRPCTYGGLSRGRSMKIIERSENRSRFIQTKGTPPLAGPCIAKELRSAR